MSRVTRLQLSLAIEPLPLKAPFRIAGYRFEAMPALTAILSAADGYGRGEASGVYYLNDEPESMRASVESCREAIEAGLDRAQLRALLPPGGARNAIDCALWELQAQRERRPVWQLAQAPHPRALITAFTLGAEDPGVVAAGALGHAQARLLKLKLDGDVDADIARIQAARRARPDVDLAVDANQAYTLERIEPLISALADQRAILLEQPFARGREADMDSLDCPIDVAADESLQGLDEVDALHGRFDVLNLKLDKCGGLTEALLIVARARELGMKLMVGNMLGTSWAAAPAFVLGQFCDVVDLDGPTFLAGDRARAVTYRDGRIHCPGDVWGGGDAAATDAAHTARLNAAFPAAPLR
ncbi:dipeptide epimerase [Pseudomonas sp. CGJS7]|uniref:dipeptide epimerase n=1 Tax=Pseudomonas sp. CGJS7 TaxID=3109348 RepID=UPI003009239A